MPVIVAGAPLLLTLMMGNNNNNLATQNPNKPLADSPLAGTTVLYEQVAELVEMCGESINIPKSLLMLICHVR